MTVRILHVIPTLDRCGAEKQLTLLARGLSSPPYKGELKVDVCVLTRDGPLRADLEQAGITPQLIGKRFKVDPLAWFRLRHHIKRVRPDIVHTWIFAADAYGRSAGKSAGVKHFVTGLRCEDPWKGWKERVVDRHLAKRTDAFVANSTGVRDFYLEYGLPEEKLQIIPNGVSPAAESSISREELLSRLGLPKETKLIGLVGRLWPQKRIKDAIWAADLLKVIRDDVHLLIIGDGPHRQRLEMYRNQAEIVDKVHFLGERNDVPDLMPHFDVVWSTSAYEGLSNVIMEAMAAAKPVVATDIPGTNELITHGKTGMLVPVGDRAAIAGCTKTLLEQPDAAGRLGEAAKEKILGEYGIDKMGRAVCGRISNGDAGVGYASIIWNQS